MTRGPHARTRTPRARGAGKMALFGLALAACLAPATGMAAARTAAAPLVIGVAAPGDTAYELTGRFTQSGDSLSGVGYITVVAGLGGAPFRPFAPAARAGAFPAAGGIRPRAAPAARPAQLILPALPLSSRILKTFRRRGAPTAVFTLVDRLHVTQRVVNANLFILDLSGEQEIYAYPVTPAVPIDWSNPASFAQGALVVRQSLRAQDVLTVIAPNQGLFSGTAVSVQTLAAPFVLGGKIMHLGQVGARGRLVYSGSGRRLSTAPLVVKAVLAGYQAALP